MGTIRYALQKGFKRSVRTAQRTLQVQLQVHLKRPKRRYIFISHPIDNTGAPMVVVQMVKEFAAKYGNNNVQLLAPGIWPGPRKELRSHGIHVDKAAAHLGRWLIGLQMGIRKNDFVLMNTVAIYENYYHYVLWALERGKLKRAFWFIHEDVAQLAVVGKMLSQEKDPNRLHRLIKKGKLVILVPSKRTKDDYDKLFRVNNVRVVPLHVNVPSDYKATRITADYERIDFILSGTPSDGRKGQLIAIPAFYNFLQRYANKDPKSYRPFKLHLVAIGNDYISQQIRWVGSSLLGDNIEFYPSLPLSEAQAVTFKCNAVICCSLNETFGLSVAEGMMMGHVVLRNNSAGVDEQLQEGVNGYLINHHDVNDFADGIEKVLNKKNPDENLRQMGAASQQIIEKYQAHSYLQTISGYEEDLNK